MNHRGFTLIELLVSIATVGVLSSFVLAALVRARDRSRVVQCKNRCRQVTVAANAFSEANESYPGAANFYLQIYPYGESDAIVETVPDPSGSLLDAIVPSPEWVVCPDDAFAERSLAATSYVLSNGVPRTFPEAAGAGVFRSGNEGVRPRDIRDGLSNTIFVSERLQSPAFIPGRSEGILDGGFIQSHAKRYHFWLDLYTSSSGDLNEFVQACRAAPEADEDWHPIDRDPFLSRFWHRIGYGFNHVMPPNGNSCYRGDRYAGRTLAQSVGGATPATSQRTGSVIASLCDGSVRSVSDGIDLNIWRALGTIAGQEPNTSF